MAGFLAFTLCGSHRAATLARPRASRRSARVFYFGIAPLRTMLIDRTVTSWVGSPDWLASALIAESVSSPLSMTPKGVTCWSLSGAWSKVAKTSWPPIPPEADALVIESDPGVKIVPATGISPGMSKPGCALPLEKFIPTVNEARVRMSVTG